MAYLELALGQGGFETETLGLALLLLPDPCGIGQSVIFLDDQDVVLAHLHLGSLVEVEVEAQVVVVQAVVH